MIDAVLVTYNRRDILFQNLAQLEKAPLIHRVIVVDNASTDGTLEEGRAMFPSVHWVGNGKNDGCIAWNRGFEYVQNRWALILDDDCFIDEDALAAALAYARSNPRVGLLAFNILNAASGKSEWGDLACGVQGAVDWPNAIGACMLTNTAAFRDIGGYKDFFLCFNDLELALALWRGGYRVVFHPGWVARHLGRRPAPSERRIHLEVRNLLWTAWGHLSPPFALALSAKFTSAAVMDSFGRGNCLPLLSSALEGMRRGWLMRGNLKGSVPRHVRRLLARNFFCSGRSKALRKRLRAARWTGRGAPPGNVRGPGCGPCKPPGRDR